MRHFHDDDDDELFDLFMMDEMDREDARKKSQKKHFPDNKKNASQEDFGEADGIDGEGLAYEV